jgi:hypothetical protein
VFVVVTQVNHGFGSASLGGVVRQIAVVKLEQLPPVFGVEVAARLPRMSTYNRLRTDSPKGAVKIPCDVTACVGIKSIYLTVEPIELIYLVGIFAVLGIAAPWVGVYAFYFAVRALGMEIFCY